MKEPRSSAGRDDSGADPSQVDAALVSRTLAGDRGAFDGLVERYQRRAVGLSYRLLGNLHDALEVSQEALLRAYRSLATLERPERFGPWLMRIVANLSLNFRRSRRTGQVGLPEDFATTAAHGRAAAEGISERLLSREAPEGEALAGELAQAVSRAIAELPDKQRLALILFAVEGWSQSDVADVLDCSVELVKWNVFQARKTLKRELADYV